MKGVAWCFQQPNDIWLWYLLHTQSLLFSCVKFIDPRDQVVDKNVDFGTWPVRACVLSLLGCYHSDVIRIASKSTLLASQILPPFRLSELNPSTILLVVQTLNDITFVTLCDSFEEVNCIVCSHTIRNWISSGIFLH